MMLVQPYKNIFTFTRAQVKWVWFFLLLASCTKTPTETHALRLAFNTHPTTFNPQCAADFASSTLVCMLFDGLTRYSLNGKVEPALAEKTDLSADQKTYTFHLRKAHWSNGKPITAFDFERSWKKVFTGPSVCTYLFYPIKNAKSCAKGEKRIDEIGVRALDENTLEVELEQPTPYFYSLTAFPSFMPSPLEEDSFSGPFRLKKMTENASIHLVKNEHFWNKNHIQVQEVLISILPDEMTALQMYEKGELDWLGGSFSPLPLDALAALKDQIEFIPSAATTFCTFNTASFPFHNIHLRKALSYAINREEIVETVMQAGQIPAHSILPPTLTDFSSPMTRLEKAQSEWALALKELGVEKLGPITLHFKASQVERRLAQALQKQWEKVLGIHVQLIQQESKVHFQTIQDRNYQMALSSWIAQFNDPISILERFKSKDHLKNYSGWENPQFIALLDQALSSDQRLTYYREAESILVEEAPIAPIYHWSFPALRSPRVERVIATPCGGILFDQVILTLK